MEVPAGPHLYDNCGKHLKLECVLTVDEVEHSIIRKALRMVGIQAPSPEMDGQVVWSRSR